jgi:hypothetical protein
MWQSGMTWMNVITASYVSRFLIGLFSLSSEAQTIGIIGQTAVSYFPLVVSINRRNVNFNKKKGIKVTYVLRTNCFAI